MGTAAVVGRSFAGAARDVSGINGGGSARGGCGLQENRQALEAEGRVLRQRGRRSATPPSRGDVWLRAFRRLRSCRGEKGRSRARAPAEKFTVIVSQKTSAGKREARAASPGRDSMHAWPLSQSLCMCAAWTREDGLD